ncbi:hypothetical protein GCM10027037_01560 [Mucilaginibacter koreensis]
MNTPENTNTNNTPDTQDDAQQGAQGRRSDTQEADGLIGQTDVPDTEGWDSATEASSASFTLEPEKGIESEVRKDNNDEDYNGKQ